jgi:hypothetical protein
MLRLEKTSRDIPTIRNKAKRTGYINSGGPERGGEETTRRELRASNSSNPSQASNLCLSLNNSFTVKIPICIWCSFSSGFYTIPEGVRFSEEFLTQDNGDKVLIENPEFAIAVFKRVAENNTKLREQNNELVDWKCANIAPRPFLAPF